MFYNNHENLSQENVLLNNLSHAHFIFSFRTSFLCLLFPLPLYIHFKQNNTEFYFKIELISILYTIQQQQQLQQQQLQQSKQQQ